MAKRKLGKRHSNKVSLKNNKLQFKTFRGKNTDILHSSKFLDSSLQKREKMAFSKGLRKKLSYKDKLLLDGYAKAVSDKNNAYHYRHK